LALSRMGHAVGLLDADIYGPSIPTMFGISGQPQSDGKQIQPLERFGIKLMSIGFLLEDPKSAVVWRGPMLHGALLQFLKDVNWGKLDFLLLDLPPGTGDVALTLAQKVRSTGAVIVTTPQEVALQDVRREIDFCRKVGVRIIGLVENMAGFVCPNCKAESRIFKPTTGGARRLAKETGVELLGSIPLDPRIGKSADYGVSFLDEYPDSPATSAYLTIIDRIQQVLEA